MKIVLDNSAMKFLDKKAANVLTVSVIGCSSWGPGEPQPTVLLEAPSDPEDFDKYEVNGKTVYVLCTLHAKNDELRIKCSKFLFVEKLIVEGLVF